MSCKTVFITRIYFILIKTFCICRFHVGSVSFGSVKTLQFWLAIYVACRHKFRSVQNSITFVKIMSVLFLISSIVITPYNLTFVSVQGCNLYGSTKKTFRLFLSNCAQSMAFICVSFVCIIYYTTCKHPWFMSKINTISCISDVLHYFVIGGSGRTMADFHNYYIYSNYPGSRFNGSVYNDYTMLDSHDIIVHGSGLCYSSLHFGR